VYGIGPGAAIEADRAELEFQEWPHGSRLRQAVLRARRAWQERQAMGGGTR
jgi:hypothetical protein